MKKAKQKLRFVLVIIAIVVIVIIALIVNLSVSFLNPFLLSPHQACGKKLYNRGLQRMEAMLYAMDR